MRLSSFSLPFWCVSVLTLAGCAVGPNYQRPTVNAPTGFREPSTVVPLAGRSVDATNQVSTNSFADLPWWGVFKDPVLQDLIRVALTNNYDLRIILTRVDQARALQTASALPVPAPSWVHGGSQPRPQHISRTAHAEWRPDTKQFPGRL